MIQATPQVSSPSTQPVHNEPPAPPKYSRVQLTAERICGHLRAFYGDVAGKTPGPKQAEEWLRLKIRLLVKDDVMDVVRISEAKGLRLDQIRVGIVEYIGNLQKALPDTPLPQGEVKRAGEDMFSRLCKYYQLATMFKRDMFLMRDGPFNDSEAGKQQTLFDPQPEGPVAASAKPEQPALGRYQPAAEQPVRAPGNPPEATL